MTIRRLSAIDVRGKRVFIRADLNVPQDDSGNITDDSRIRASVPGIRDALARGAAVMVTSHLGRPAEGQCTEADSLAPIGKRLSELLGAAVPLVKDWANGGAWHAAQRQAGRGGAPDWCATSCQATRSARALLTGRIQTSARTADRPVWAA